MADTHEHACVKEALDRVEWCRAWYERQHVQHPRITPEWLNALKDVEALAAELLLVRARLHTAETALQDFKQQGLLCDLNPTRMVPTNEAMARADEFWFRYLERADQSVRRRAAAALCVEGTESE